MHSISQDSSCHMVVRSKACGNVTMQCGASKSTWSSILFVNKKSRLQLWCRSGELRMQKLKVPSGENTELKHSPFKAWSRSVYSHTCYAYCQGFLPYLFLPFQSNHLHFFPKPLPISPVWLWLTHGSCVGLQNKIGQPARGRFPC